MYIGYLVEIRLMRFALSRSFVHYTWFVKEDTGFCTFPVVKLLIDRQTVTEGDRSSRPGRGPSCDCQVLLVIQTFPFLNIVSRILLVLSYPPGPSSWIPHNTSGATRRHLRYSYRSCSSMFVTNTVTWTTSAHVLASFGLSPAVHLDPYQFSYSGRWSSRLLTICRSVSYLYFR